MFAFFVSADTEAPDRTTRRTRDSDRLRNPRKRVNRRSRGAESTRGLASKCIAVEEVDEGTEVAVARAALVPTDY